MAEIIQQQDSRRIFINTLEEINDPKNIIVTCDVGFNYLSNTKTKVFNFGVTEASSAMISTGLGISGYTVWFYSMINFVTFRVHEMIRNGIVQHKADVKIIGVKGSEKFKFLGFSHNLLWEDEEIEWLQKLMPCYKPKLEEIPDLIRKLNKEKTASYIRL